MRETEVLAEQPPLQGVLVCDHAGRAINKLSRSAMRNAYVGGGLGWTRLTLHPKPYTIHLSPYIIITLHPAPYTLLHTPYTIHPTPYTLHPTPYTLHPAPCTCFQRSLTLGGNQNLKDLKDAPPPRCPWPFRTFSIDSILPE